MNTDFILKNEDIEKAENTLKDTLLPITEQIGLSVSAEQAKKLCAVYTVMLSNPMYASVSKIFDVKEFAVKHLFDSIAPLALSKKLKNASEIADLGAGAGFPCLPLAVMKPECQFLAVDARQKSVDFINETAKKLGLKNVSAMHMRIEDMGRNKKYRETLKMVICRALSAVKTIVEYSLPLLKNGGTALFFKGPKIKQELDEAQNAFNAFNIKQSDIALLSLLPPKAPFERNFVEVYKTKNVPAIYPRKAGTPSSKPL